MYISYNENKLLSEKQRLNNNKKFINDYLKKLKYYFDNVYKSIDPNILLDDEQRIAILNDEDALMIIAGAGSGKTTTITAKVKYLVDILKVNPKKILIISYTNKAVNELKERINQDFDIPVDITTFHKFALSILNKFNNYKIIDESKIKNTINDYILTQLNNLKVLRLISTVNKESFLKNYFKLMVGLSINIDNLTNISYKVISSIKINKSDYYEIYDLVKEKKQKNNCFLDFIDKVYKYVINHLTYNNLIDFEDMINIACRKIKSLDSFRYKYIIVDEYQDISQNRFELLKCIYDHFNIKLVVVGDDWQSIFKFSGSRIDLFTEFSNIFPRSNILKISNTYRNSQQLINIAGNFIMKNSKQISKNLKSNKSLSEPVIILMYHKDKVLKLKQQLNEFRENDKILLLGRYTFDCDFLNKSVDFVINGENITYRRRPNMSIVFLTVHSAKGLGYDQVIVLNNENGVYGFPSKRKNDKFINLFIDDKDNYYEERRLFYVALTRTKNRVYLLVNKHKKSCFIKELLNGGYDVKKR